MKPSAEYYRRMPGDGYTTEEIFVSFANGAGAMLTRVEAINLARQLRDLLSRPYPFK